MTKEIIPKYRLMRRIRHSVGVFIRAHKQALQVGVIVVMVGSSTALLVYQQRQNTPSRGLTTQAAGGGVVGPSATCDYYASPIGSSTAAGSSSDPWDLQTALGKTAEIIGGKTLCLKNGTYVGRYLSTIAGTAGTNNQVTIRSAPGEWATLDGNYSATLANPIDATTRTITFTDASGLREGQTVLIDTTENIQLGTRSGNSFIQSNRGWNAGHGGLTTGSSHSAGAPVIPVDPVIQIDGSYTWLRDFEVTNSSTNRISVWQERGPGIQTSAPGAHIINMVIHDTGHPGIGFWEGVGDGGEVYGSLIWGTGTYDDNATWTRGAGIYTQNQVGTRYLRDNIWFRNFTEGIDIFTTNGYADGFHVEGNISFDNRNSQNIWAGSANINPIQRLVVVSNYTYRRETGDNQWDTRFGYTTTNVDAVIQDNYLVSNNVVLNPSGFSQLTVTGNTLYARSERQIHIDQSNKSSYTINNNHYYGNNQFTYTPGASGILNFSQWKTDTGYDASSDYSPGVPSDTYFVRPNLYESGRANIAVYNWSGQSSVSVDVSSVLTVGDTYVVRDAQNYFAAPIAQGTYNGGSISIPMNLTQVAPIVGTVTHISNIDQHTAPEFGAFVLASTAGGTPYATPYASPYATPYGTPYTSPYATPYATPYSSPASGGGGGGAGGGTYLTPYNYPTPYTSPGSGGASSGGSTSLAYGSIKLVYEGKTFFVIKDGKRYGVTNPGVLFSYGLEFKDAVAETAAENLLPYIDNLKPGDGALVKKPGNTTVFVIAEGQKFGFVSEAVFKGLGYSFSTVLEVTANELDALPRASDLSNSPSAHKTGAYINQDGTIYRISNGQKQGIPSIDVWNSMHKDNDFSDVVLANSADRVLPLGGNLAKRVVQ